MYFEGAIFGEPPKKLFFYLDKKKTLKNISERAHFDHSYQHATMLKMYCVTDVFLGTWLKFTEQLF